MPEAFKLPFLRKEKLSKDTYSFFFDRTKSLFDFIPGQYIKMTIKNPNPDERGTSRLFTVASSPTEGEYIDITTRIVQSTFKKDLFNLVAGAEIDFFGPMGAFILGEEEKRPIVFLAGGIGITPFHSMMRYAADKNVQNSLTLFVSFSTSDDVIFQNELQKIQSQHQNLRSIYTVSQPQGKPESSTKPWNGETGRISEELIKKYVQNVVEPIYMIAGPPKMVEAMETLVVSMEVPGDQIKKENFVGY